MEMKNPVIIPLIMIHLISNLTKDIVLAKNVRSTGFKLPL